MEPIQEIKPGDSLLLVLRQTLTNDELERFKSLMSKTLGGRHRNTPVVILNEVEHGFILRGESDE